MSLAHFKVSLEYPSPLELFTALSVFCTPDSFRQVFWSGCNVKFCVTCLKQQLLEQGSCGAESWLSPADVGVNQNTQITAERMYIEIDIY